LKRNSTLNALVAEKIMGGIAGRYSQDIIDAWNVMEKLGGYRPALAKTGLKGWRAIFYSGKSPLTAVYADDKTAPRAICRAALLLESRIRTS
jgi:hypothetical protein